MAKRLNEENTISDVLKQFVTTYKLHDGIVKVDVKTAWFRLMGNGVTNYTEEVVLKNNTLYVKLTSSVLRDELGYGKEKIIKMINEEIGEEVVKALVLR
jgi:hypothetical protein